MKCTQPQVGTDSGCPFGSTLPLTIYNIVSTWLKLCGAEPNNLSALLRFICYDPVMFSSSEQKTLKKKTLWSNQTRPAFHVTLFDNRVKSKQMLFSERKNSLLRKEKMGVWVGVQVDSKYRKKQLQCSLLFQKCDKTENLSSCLYFVPTDAAWKMSWL